MRAAALADADQTATARVLAWRDRLQIAGQTLTTPQLQALDVAARAEMRRRSRSLAGARAQPQPTDFEDRFRLREENLTRQNDANLRILDAVTAQLNAEQLKALRTQFETGHAARMANPKPSATWLRRGVSAIPCYDAAPRPSERGKNMGIDYEKLGAFYLGKVFDPAAGKLSEEPLLYDSRDLTTHAVCVGMTGSGKTGLCLALLEEAAIDGIPAICIDPKGDLGNLALTFPNLAPRDFAGWVDEGEAARKGLSIDDYAAKVSEQWRAGLAEWDQKPERIQKFRDAADVAIYTPGSDSGLPLSILQSLAPPPAELLADGAALSERIGSVISGLLTLLGRDADPLKSRDHILLSNLLDHAWRAGRAVDLATLVATVQKPPIDKLGALDLETFFPAKERMELALAINGLLASPRFATWTRGEPLEAQRLLFTPEGKPRIAIVSIAHLSDAERMFVVTLLLNEVIGWMRRQPGTSALRAILYMDEIFGYFPPSAVPAVQPPMLTLLKQARAFGLGVVLATQNPVDLDYKGLGNTGTWLIGRLQTERDRDRLLDGLTSALADGGAVARRPGETAGFADAARVPDAQCARRCASAAEEPLGAVVPARAADAGGDLAADDAAQAAAAAHAIRHHDHARCWRLDAPPAASAPAPPRPALPG